MDSIRLFIWNSFLNKLPSYTLRRFFFISILKNKMEKSSAIHMGIELICVGGISIGHNSTVNKNVILDGRNGITIGNQVSVSAGSVLLTGSHDVDSHDFKYIGNAIIIEDYVWLGTQSLILPGVVASKGSVVGARSVVTKSVLPFSIVVGNPARHIRFRDKELKYNPIWKPRFQ